MKFQVTFKTPDALNYAVEHALTSALDTELFSVEETEDKRTELEEAASKFIKYSEYVTIEIDTETQTATVLPVTR